MIYGVTWIYDGNKYHGFVKANTNSCYEAGLIAKSNLQKGCMVIEVFVANENMVTPQSVCINFPNESEYSLFG